MSLYLLLKEKVGVLSESVLCCCNKIPELVIYKEERLIELVALMAGKFKAGWLHLVRACCCSQHGVMKVRKREKRVR